MPNIEHGSFRGIQTYEKIERNFVILNITCDPGYHLFGYGIIFCVEGVWSNSFPVCIEKSVIKNYTGKQKPCVLPRFPNNGIYKLLEPDWGRDDFTIPRLELFSAFINTTCDPGYVLVGEQAVFCVNGDWSAEMPKCIAKSRACYLPPFPERGSYGLRGLQTKTPVPGKGVHHTTVLDVICNDNNNKNIIVTCTNHNWNMTSKECTQ